MSAGLKFLIAVGELGGRAEPVGSRRTCDPPPTDTDDDWLVYVDEPKADRLRARLRSLGFCRQANDYRGAAVAPFESYRGGGDLNVILTQDERFYEKFMFGTELATKLNLMEKPDWIKLFQTVLYGR